MKNQDSVLKLAVATLDYSRDGLARVILSKILTAATDVSHEECIENTRAAAAIDYFGNGVFY